MTLNIFPTLYPPPPPHHHHHHHHHHDHDIHSLHTNILYIHKYTKDSQKAFGYVDAIINTHGGIFVLLSRVRTVLCFLLPMCSVT